MINALLDYWEHTMTDSAVDEARQFEGPPKDRILFLMERVMLHNLAGYDLPVWHWAQSDVGA